MAGSGDLDSLKLLRTISLNEELPFSALSGVNNSIGMLFLGGGKYTVGNTMKDVALLLISFYPIYSNDIMDNECYRIV